MMKSIHTLAGIFLMTLTGLSQAKTWTSVTGQTVEAEFVKVEQGRVWLQSPDGKMMNTAFDGFVPEDQALIRELYKQAQEKALAAAAAAEAEARKAKGELQAVVLAKWKPGQIISCVTPDKTAVPYHVYIPSSFDPDSPPPLVYAFSPGGSGKGQLNAMKKSAEKAGWIVVGCDKLKNGMTDEKLEFEIEDAILADVPVNVPHDPARVYLSGMSGGAMRSYGISSRRHDLNFAGILAFGGWMGGADNQKKLDFPKGMSVAMINGDKDSGANGWADSDAKVLKSDKCEVKQFSFLGGHTMAPSEVIDEAMAWLMSQPPRK